MVTIFEFEIAGHRSEEIVVNLTVVVNHTCALTSVERDQPQTFSATQIVSQKMPE